MVMEYSEDSDVQDGVVKWPFYASSLFILVLVFVFAYLHFEKEGVLGQWQITTCIFASAIASILVFIPHLMDRFIHLAFDPQARSDEDLNRKTFLEIKEIRNDMDSLAVKVDKVPSVVDKILSNNQNTNQQSQDFISGFRESIDLLKKELYQKLSQLEHLAASSPLLPDPDPMIEQSKKSLDQLNATVSRLSNQLDELKKSVSGKMESSLPVEHSVPPKSSYIEKASPSPSVAEESFSERVQEEASQELEEIKTEEISESVDETAVEVKKDFSSTIDENPEITDKKIESIEGEIKKEIPKELPEVDQEEGDRFVKDSIEDQEPDSSIESRGKTEKVENEPEELELDLPDPKETLRKVDALLAGEDTDLKKEPQIEKKPNSGATSVTANVMIGIGNKPFLRGEGPGLNWDKGVPMNFIEIGKWAWSPSRKNAALTVQVYRNDEEPDQGGKVEVKPGDKIEITPEF